MNLRRDIMKNVWYLLIFLLLLVFGAKGVLFLKFMALKGNAKKGDPIAQLNLAEIYKESKNDKRAVAWYEKSAASNNITAIVELANIYDSGLCGETENPRKAFQMYKKAAEQGNNGAQSKLAEMYLDGRGVTKNIEMAKYWHKKSSEEFLHNVMKNIGNTE